MDFKAHSKPSLSSIIALILWALLLTILPDTGHATIKPVRVEMAAKPGRIYPFKLDITNDNLEPRTYTIALFYYTQDQGGYQKQLKVQNTDQPGIWDWFHLDSIKINERFSIDGKQSKSVTGKVKIPRKDSIGFHNLLVVATEYTPADDRSPVTLHFGSGSIFEVNVIGPKRRPEYNIESITVDTNTESMSSQTQMAFTNKSPLKGRLQLEMQLRQNKRLIVKTKLLTDEANNSQKPYSSIFPNARVNLSGEFNKALPSGQYDMLIVGDFNGDRLKRFKQQITVQ
jgi:hypothetical protein